MSHVFLPISQLFHRRLIIFRLEKCLDVKHGVTNVLTKPARVLQVTWKHKTITRVFSFERSTRYTFMTQCIALLLRSYCVGAGELAGDVECDEVFPNNYIRHTVTIISHLVEERRYRHTYCCKRLDLCVAFEFHSPGQIHHRHSRI